MIYSPEANFLNGFAYISDKQLNNTNNLITLTQTPHNIFNGSAH